MESKVKKLRILAIVVFLSGIFGLEITLADINARKRVIELLTSAGLSEELNAGVKISADDTAVLCIADEGNFFMQYIIIEPNVSAEPNVMVESNVKIPFSCNKAVMRSFLAFRKLGLFWVKLALNWLCFSS